MKYLKSSSALVLAMSASVYAGDYSFTGPVRPSAGLVNDWLRQDNPSMAAWDVGVLARLRYEIRDNFGIAGSPGSFDFRQSGADVDNAYLLYRIKPHVGYTAPWYSVFVEGRFSGSTGDDRNPNPESDGIFDLHQAFVTIGNHKEFPLSLKVGRQELSYGDERLIGAFEWNNIGRVFDTAKLRWQNAYFAADFFSGRVILPRDNHFNMPNDYDWFSGIYTSTKLIPKQVTEVYLLSRNVGAKSLAANAPTGPNGPSARDIYTLGVRAKSNPGEFGGWDYTGEVMGQYGHFNDPTTPLLTDPSLEHIAYAFAFLGGYTWRDASWTPRLGLEYDFGSGDSNPTDNKHQTFENLFPTNHKFYGYMDLFSLQNIHDVRLITSAKPLPRISVVGEAHSFWLANTHDSFYTVAGARRGTLAPTPGNSYGINPSYSSFVGAEIDVVANYAFSPQGSLEFGYGHFFRGDYVKQSLSAIGSADANWFYVQTKFAF
jgi:Alginate export